MPNIFKGGRGGAGSNAYPSVNVHSPDVASGETSSTPSSSSFPSSSSSTSTSTSTPGRPIPSSSTSYHAGTTPGGSSSLGRASNSPIHTRTGRVRSRTSTISYTPPLPPVMSRENSLEEVQDHHDAALGQSLPSSSLLPPRLHDDAATLGRKASKSVSNVRPTTPNARPRLSAQRTTSYHGPSLSAGPSTMPIPSLLSSSPKDAMNPRKGLKRRISTPSLAVQREEAERQEELRPTTAAAGSAAASVRESASRARSTSTSIVVPDDALLNRTAGPSTYAALASAPPYRAGPAQPTPPASWGPIIITPASPAENEPQSNGPGEVPYAPHPRATTRSSGLLTSAYDLGEASFQRLARWVRPAPTHHLRRRGSDEDSEKGLDADEDISADSTGSAARTSEDSLRRNGRYWGVWDKNEPGEDGYFSLPPTPPEEKSQASLADFEGALADAGINGASLPTPALSTRSLSRMGSKKRSRRAADARDREGAERDGWLTTVYGLWRSLGSGRRGGGGKTAEVLRDLGWTVALLVGLFVVTAATALWMIQALPITQLKHLPTSTTDLQLLSAEIRSYMASSEVGWWHTVGVLTFVGCWKHAWSVPGAVVLNILVGSVLEPMPALLLLTIITATGSLFSYLLSRPLAPLIAVLFPKPLALVRAALAPDQIPSPPSSATLTSTDEKITAVQLSSDPASAPIGGQSPSGSVWRRLLIMRAMGFVPWSGMNVACGVVNVDWRVFWLTTAAGSASWSYVTASVGNILSRLAIPPAALDSDAGGGEMIDGESLTSLLRDPVLIAKLVFLSGLTLLPVVLKKRNAPAQEDGYRPSAPGLGLDTDPTRLGPTNSALSPTSPLTRSLARFTPTPAAFDLLSFGRTAVRQGANVVAGAVGSAKRLVGGMGR